MSVAVLRSKPDADQRRWRAVVDRDAAADGQFVYAVKTTGVYCRPACPSRRPNRANVAFFDTAREAEWAGFRPCKKCRPQGERSPAEQAVVAACRFIDQSPEPPPLAEIAAHVGLSPAHFHRLFSKTLGVSPKAYAAAGQGERLRDQLADASISVTAAVYTAGYRGAGQVYSRAKTELGMTPARFKRGGAGQTIRYTTAPCHLGQLVVAVTERGICAIQFGDSVAECVEQLTTRFPAAEIQAGDGRLRESLKQVLAHLKTPHRRLNVPLDIQGTAFQRKVWQALREIPAGETTTYTQLAAKVGRPRAVRAVASACAANRLAVIVPCHRVVRSDGGLGGYRWGLNRKRRLLDDEATSDGTG